jgi:hypothetical protein
MNFSYPPDTRPLDGYTIKRAVKRGGFGEVYYAVSDGGKEVALKLLRQNLDVELRGVSQCLNLSHPNLVSLHDVRTDKAGQHWVVMEYMSGPTLDRAIEAHPGGMPLAEVRHWLAGIAAGLTYLHDHGLVHRDLKPANVFREGETVKVGDVGLSKFITESQRSAQTQSVGTVHYMAPEVAQGHYGREIDVYAMGVMLYEMLTGNVPFDGESQAEILMKHLTQKPDLSVLPTRLRSVLARALEKDPAVRTPSAARLNEEFQRALDGAEPAEPLDIPAENIYPKTPKRQPPQFVSTYVDRAARRPEYRRPEYRPRYRYAGPGERPAGGLGFGKWLLIGLVLLWFFPGMFIWDPDVTGFTLVAAVVAGGVWLIYRLVTAATDREVRSYMVRYPNRYAMNRNSPHPAYTAAPQPVQQPAWSPGHPAHPAAERWKARQARRAYRYATKNYSPLTARRVEPRQRMMELFGSLAIAGVCAALFALALTFTDLFDTPTQAGLFAAVTAVGAWLLLAVSKVGEGADPSKSYRRTFATLAGVATGLVAYFLDQSLLVDYPHPDGGRGAFHGLLDPGGSIPLAAAGQPMLWGYVAFFAGLFGLRRWWWHADAFRPKRFRLMSVLFTVFIAWVWSMAVGFPILWGLTWAATLSSVVQLAAAWVPPTDRERLTEGDAHVA